MVLFHWVFRLPVGIVFSRLFVYFDCFGFVFGYGGICEGLLVIYSLLWSI